MKTSMYFLCSLGGSIIDCSASFGDLFAKYHNVEHARIIRRFIYVS